MRLIAISLNKFNQDDSRYFQVNMFDLQLVWVYGISTIEGYLMPDLFYIYKQFYFKDFTLALVHSLSVKTVLFPTILFRQQN